MLNFDCKYVELVGFYKYIGHSQLNISHSIVPVEWKREQPGGLTKWLSYIHLTLHPARKPLFIDRDEEQYWANVEAETGIKH